MGVICMNTLALNVAETPVAIIPVKKAIKSLVTNRAIARKSYDITIQSSEYASIGFSFLKSVKNDGYIISIPSVIQYTHSDFIPKKYTKTLPFSRKNVYIRDRGICQYCGKKVSISTFTFDHVVPQCMGGRSTWDNVVVSCLVCNSEKGSKPLNKYKRSLIRKPFAPRLNKAAPAHMVSKVASEILHETWADYIYWDLILNP